MDNRPPIRILYSNHRGEVVWREILPVQVYWGATDFYPEECWLLEAFDLMKNARRTFRMANVLRWDYGTGPFPEETQ